MKSSWKSNENAEFVVGACPCFWLYRAPTRRSPMRHSSSGQSPLAFALLACCPALAGAPRHLPIFCSEARKARSACAAAGCSRAPTATCSPSCRISSRSIARISMPGDRRGRRSRDDAARERRRRASIFRRRARIRSIAISSTISGCRSRRRRACARLNLSGSVKFALTPRGREISSRAWIPSAVTPYVGAGGGVLHYQFLQFGDFIDVDSANSDISPTRCGRRAGRRARTCSAAST